jgi:hypothetical protein
MKKSEYGVLSLPPATILYLYKLLYMYENWNDSIPARQKLHIKLIKDECVRNIPASKMPKFRKEATGEKE